MSSTKGNMMDAKQLVKQTSPQIVQSVRIPIDGFDDVVEQFDGSVRLYNCGEDNEWCIYLGEFDMWHWVAPLSTLKAYKEDDSIWESDEVYIEISEIINLLTGDGADENA